MTDGARPYAEYKLTEVPWLGKIPAHWEVRPLRTLLKQRNEQNRPLKTTQILSLSIAHGVTLYSHEGRGGNKSKSDLTAYKLARKGDIILNSMNVIVGAVGLSKYTGAISPVYYALYPLSDDVDINYYNTVFSNYTFQRYLLIYAKGILIKESDSGKLNTIRMKISSDDLKTILLPFPTPEEQTKIACFLNWKNIQINRFIRNRQRLIEVLNEQKQAIINQAVIRGLNPNVPLKPSGIDWLGDIPEHWVVKPLKRWVYINERVLPDTTDPEYMFDYLDIGCVGTGKLSRKPSRIRFGDAPSRARRILQRGDTIISTVRTYLRAVYFISDEVTDLVASTGFAVLTPCKGVIPEYLEITLQSDPFVNLVTANSIGIAYPAIAETKLGSLLIVIPSTADEQQSIVDEVRSETKAIISWIERTEREIDLIREYRTRLISDVVTGKVDVRHLAPSLGSEDLEEMVEEHEPLDEPGELDEESMDGEVSYADD